MVVSSPELTWVPSSDTGSACLTTCRGTYLSYLYCRHQGHGYKWVCEFASASGFRAAVRVAYELSGQKKTELQVNVPPKPWTQGTKIKPFKFRKPTFYLTLLLLFDLFSWTFSTSYFSILCLFLSPLSSFEGCCQRQIWGRSVTWPTRCTECVTELLNPA